MDIYEALYTTRAMRRMTGDAVPPEVIGRILDAGLRAPTGGNAQDWRFVAVTDRTKIRALGVHYKAALGRLFEGHYKAANDEVRAAVAAGATDRRIQQVSRVLNSSEHLAEHSGESPLVVFGFTPSTGNPGSIWPALWSMCLAARADGVGSTVTTVLGAFAAAETAEILGIPAGETWVQHACIPMGYPTGRWGVPDRKPISKVCFHDAWGTPADFPVEPRSF